MRGYVPRTVGAELRCVWFRPAGANWLWGDSPRVTLARGLKRGASRNPEAVRRPSVAVIPRTVSRGPTSAEGDFQLPARQLTPQARERDQRSP